ncbi:MAG: hypothetical protein DMF57_10105 [Acidobacteria bacterium]|nr:MAG: hypothetical protein DMF57_10105 [Acidobacteriota bacterium]
MEDGPYRIAAYSEFMPAPRMGQKPLGERDPLLVRGDDPIGWPITEYEEAFELRPGLEQIGRQLIRALHALGRGHPARGISKGKLKGNPAWPPALSEHGAPAHERYVLLLPLALSMTQDDKGRVRWTLFGASELGAAHSFWRGFTAEDQAIDFFRRLLSSAYGEKSVDAMRIHDGPSFIRSHLWSTDQSLRGIRYLITFTPFEELPTPVRDAYRSGDLHLLPFPGSLLFFHVPAYQFLRRELPFAEQIPLLHAIDSSEAPYGIRVPQSGWIHEPRDGAPSPARHHGPLRNTTRRTHRWTRVHRHDDALEMRTLEERVSTVLFSAEAADLGLYGKPMARNSQIWTVDHHLLLDGPRADRNQLTAAIQRVDAGGMFGYRFHYPAMRAGRHELYWHRPLVAWFSPKTKRGELLDDAPLGMITAYDEKHHYIELTPRLLDRAPHRLAIESFGRSRETSNVHKILECWELDGKRPLDPSFARSLLRIPKAQTLDEWLDELPPALGAELRRCVGSGRLKPAATLTFDSTATRGFETRYWKTIARLAQGRFINKDNADLVLDRETQSALVHHHRDLERLADHLLDYYESLDATCGWLPFHWQTDFNFRWSGGWIEDQQRRIEERDLVVVIPGRDRSRAVIMADHYDTAYMEDKFGKRKSGRGPRLAAPGADDNHSATAALMLAAPIFLRLSREGKLGCDIWLVHLTGEEFPADCLGSRHLCERLVEKNLLLHRRRAHALDLSDVSVEGVFVLDMVAHNSRRHRDIFQICPGSGAKSLALARVAQEANVLWNASTLAWNAKAARRRAKTRRSTRRLPAIAPHLALHGDVRPPSDPYSTLYNTDGQIFSDVGVPVVLFMENYDINRHGYHDSHDTMENIDLDYGAAVVAIAIETVARVAAAKETR